MLKAQDCVILLKLMANPSINWSQRDLATVLCMSLSETNASLKRLNEAGLLRNEGRAEYIPIIAAAEEFLINGLKYLIPAKLGEYCRGIPTAIGAPLFKDKIALSGNEPIPVWADAHGTERGISLTPIHPSVLKTLRKVPDDRLYELLVLIDMIRLGRPRERNLAIKLFKEKIHHEREQKK